MKDVLLFTSLLTFALASVIMFLIPEKTFPKKLFNPACLSKKDILKNAAAKGYYRKLFLISSIALMLLMFFLKYVML